MVNISIAGSSSTATSVNSTHNTFTIYCNPAIKIPANAKNIKVYLRSLQVPYSFVNISSTLNNNTFYFTDNASVINKIPIVFDNGLYSLTQLNNLLQIKLQNIINTSGYAFTNSVFSFIPDSSTDKTFLLITSSGYQVNFPSGSLGGVVGYATDRRCPSGNNLTTSASTYFTGDNPAVFKNVTDIIVSTSLPVNFYYNNQSRNILATIPVDTTPQNNIVYPYNNLPEFNKLQCDLAGSSISSVTVSILSQSLSDLDLNGKDWSLTFNVEYDLE